MWVNNIENCQSKNRTCNIGFISLYFKNNKEYFVAGFRNYGNLYQKYNKDREICEKWLKNRRYEIENVLEITKDKKIFGGIFIIYYATADLIECNFFEN